MTLKEKVIQAREDNPTRRAIDIASDFGCSRERVRQLLQAAGLKTTVPSYVPTRIRHIGPRVHGYRIAVSQPRPPIYPAINKSESCDVCPRCNGTFLYLAEEYDTWDVKCITCGQLISFTFKALVLS